MKRSLFTSTAAGALATARETVVYRQSGGQIAELFQPPWNRYDFAAVLSDEGAEPRKFGREPTIVIMDDIDNLPAPTAEERAACLDLFLNPLPTRLKDQP